MSSEILSLPNRNKSRPFCVVPMVVRQVLSCDSSPIRFFGTQVHIVYLVGIVRNLSKTSSNGLSFHLEDHTGTIKANVLSETDQTPEELTSEIRPGRYARVFACREGPQSISVLRAFGIEDGDAITNHLLQVILSRLRAEAELRRQLNDAVCAGAALMGSFLSDEEVEENDTNFMQFKNEIQRKVYGVIRSEASFGGVNRNGVLMHFTPALMHDVMQAIEYLVNEGLVYYSEDRHLYPVIHCRDPEN